MHWPVQYLALSLQVSLATAFQGLARDGDSSRLSSHILRRHRRWICRSPRDLARPCNVSRCICELPRTLHLRVLPAFDLQVALNLDSIQRVRRFSSSGFPQNSISPDAPLDASRVAPVFASSGPAGDRSSSYPDSRVLQRLCCVGCEFPRCFALPAAPPNTGSRYNPGSCIFRLYRQRIFELPRTSRSSVLPVLELSVSLALRSSRLLLPTTLWVSPRASSSGLASGLSFRVSPDSYSLGVGWWIPEFPQSSQPPAPPSLRLQVSLNPASTAGSMIGSRSSRTSHPRLSPRMNLRIQSGYATSMGPTLDAFIQSH